MTEPWRVEGGPKAEAVGHHHAKLPARVPGQHLWIVMSMFKVTPAPGGKYLLDTENPADDRRARVLLVRRDVVRTAGRQAVQGNMKDDRYSRPVKIW